MRDYEIMYIMNPNSSEEIYTKTNKKVEDLIANSGGSVTFTDAMGMRDLATEFKKLRQGYYMRLEFSAPADFIAQFNDKLRIDEVVFRHLITSREAEPVKAGSD